MRRRKSGSAWMAAVAIALLAAFAWTAFRGSDVAPDGAPAARTSQTLELPPPMTGDGDAPPSSTRYPDFLPAEAIDTLQRIGIEPFKARAYEGRDKRKSANSAEKKVANA